MTIPKAAEKNSSRQPTLYCVNCGDKLGENAVDAFQSFVNNAPARIIVEDAIQEIYRLNNEPDFEFEDECVLCVHCCLLFSQMFGLFRLFEARQKPGSFLASCCSDFLRNAAVGKKGNANVMDVEEAYQADDFEGCQSSDEGEKNDDERSLAADSPPTNSLAAHSHHDEEDRSQSGAEDAEGTKTDANSLSNAEQAELIFKCADCSEAFKQAVQLRIHRVSAHNSREDFKCAVCKNAYLSEAAFRRHMFEHLKDAKNKSGIKCPVCHRSFPNRSALAKHKSLMHSFGPKKRLKQMTKPPKTDVTKTLKQMTMPPKTDVTKTPKSDVTKPPKTGVTKCGLCDKTFGNVFLLRKHRVEVHIMGQPSNDSDQALSQSVLLIGTEMDIGQEKVSLFGPNDFLTCSDCLQQYDHKKSKSFLEHRRTMHPDRPKYQCYVCQLVFTNTKTLMMHIHPELMNYECEICNNTFSTMTRLKAHRQKIYQKVKCEHCDYVSNVSSVQKHGRMVHKLLRKQKRLQSLQEKQQLKEENRKRANKLAYNVAYKCADCDESYKKFTLLLSHRTESHPDQEKLKCPHCHMTRTQNQALRNHMLRHDESKDWPCGECPLRFLLKVDRNKHLQEVHGIRKTKADSLPLPPQTILKLLSGEMSGTEKQKLTSKIVYKCPDCDEQFRSAANMGNHRVIVHGVSPSQRFKCYHCSSISASLQTFLMHLERHGEKIHLCQQCGKCFTTRDYLKQHVGLMHDQVAGARLRAKYKRSRDKKKQQVTTGSTSYKKVKVVKESKSTVPDTSDESDSEN